MSEVNTTTRWSQHCRAVAKDGRKCNMYTPHEGEKHTPKNAIESDRWEDGE